MSRGSWLLLCYHITLSHQSDDITVDCVERQVTSDQSSNLCELPVLLCEMLQQCDQFFF